MWISTVVTVVVYGAGRRLDLNADRKRTTGGMYAAAAGTPFRKWSGLREPENNYVRIARPIIPKYPRRHYRINTCTCATTANPWGILHDQQTNSKMRAPPVSRTPGRTERPHRRPRQPARA